MFAERFLDGSSAPESYKAKLYPLVGAAARAEEVLDVDELERGALLRAESTESGNVGAA